MTSKVPASDISTEAAIDETTALLAARSETVTDVAHNGLLRNQSFDDGSTQYEDEHDGNNDDDNDKPLAKDQILVLCVARIVEPIAFFCIFPFINQMIWDTGEVPETDVGFYSGLIVCLDRSLSSTFDLTTCRP